MLNKTITAVSDQFSHARGQLSIIYVTNNLPYPPVSGGQLREFQMLTRLGRNFQVHLVTFVKNTDAIQADIPETLKLTASVTVLQTSCHLAPQSYPLRVRSHYHPRGKQAIKSAIERFHASIVHIEGYFLSHYVPRSSALGVILAAENIEFDLELGAENLGVLPVGTSELTRMWELNAWNRADHLIGVTQEDVSEMRRLCTTRNIRCVTNGMDHLKLPLCDSTIYYTANTFLYIANYMWLPSLDAAQHLLQNIWPIIRRLSPSARLILAGAGMSAELIADAVLTPGVEIHGPYDEFSEIAGRASVMLFPLRFGGGVKVKIIEAISAGLSLVTTPLALRGFPMELQTFVTTAEAPDDFARASIKLAQSADRRARAQSARRILVDSLPSWDDSAENLGAVWRDAAQKSS